MAGLSFKNIAKPLDSGGAFKNFNLEIDDGEFVAVVGKDGCGKAELIRIAEGYGGSYEGEVNIGGRRVTRFSRGEASLVNEVPLFGTPGEEIVSIAKRKLGSKTDAEKALAAAAERLGTKDLMDVRWSRLDPRDKLRAGLTRALAVDAKVLLINDPFVGADRRVASLMRVDLMDFYREMHMSCLLATHSGENAMSLATRIVVLDKGEIRQTDTPQNIYDYPADTFVAEYFGRELINMIPVMLTETDGGVFAAFGDNMMLVPQGKISHLVDPSYIGRRVLMGVRPENLHYEQSFISISPESAVDVTVRHVELKGYETYLHTRMSGVEGDVIARVDPRCIAGPGMRMTLGIDANHLHLFDPDSKKSILSRI